MRSLLEALPVAVYVTEAEGRVIYWNQEAERLWGKAPQLGVTQWWGSWRLFRPDHSPMPQDEYPVAMAMKERRAIRGVEALALRPDGTFVRLLSYPAPLFNEDVLVGVVNILVDITKRDSTNYFQQRLSAIVEWSEDAIISKDLDGVITSWNLSAQRLFGYTAAEAVGRPVTILIPNDRLQEEKTILDRIRRGGRVMSYETIRRRKDGTFVDVSLTISPLHDASGRIVGASKIARDITERRRAQQYQKLLLGEMSHRVKNLLAVAAGLVSLSARTARTPAELAKSVQERLGAYSRAHELTRPDMTTAKSGGATTATIPTLVQTIIAPYVEACGAAGTTNVTVEGPEIPADGDAVPNLALVLHEFTTNAAKYGALSQPGGTVRITFRIDNGMLELIWREEGGPPVEEIPERTGFGSLLASRTVEGQLHGSLEREWRREGVVITLRVPADRLSTHLS
ncbi:MAG: PAS domain S-box protein [Alphaproteobacteria bacterium]|nr:PAS domain S-box protein [Alphaproteobacteria bacterium]